MSSITENRSSLKEFLASIATIRGDLSNITAPPFVLAPQSTVSFPAYWAEHPSLFTAPSSEPDPAKRALLVLRWFLASLKNQQYGGRDEKDGVKKPLNAFLGEVFLASWDGAGSSSQAKEDRNRTGETRLVSEQVSHHPPVTACYLWNDIAGVRAEGYTCQEISFNGSVNIKQIGHAILHVDAYDEDYLIPLPNVKVKGILSGTPYPELYGTYHIISSSGPLAEIDFSGKGFWSGKKNSVEAVLYTENSGRKDREILFKIEGQWSGKLIVRGADGTEIEMLDVNALHSSSMSVEDLEKQDPWESKRAWKGVIDALNRGDMQGTVDEKSKLEKAQRELRKLEESKGLKWETLFFNNVDGDPVFERLAGVVGEQLNAGRTVGVWKFNHQKWENGIEKPFHGNLRPDGRKLD